MTDEEKEKYRGGLIATCKTYCHIDYDDDIEILELMFDTTLDEMTELIPNFDRNNLTSRQKLLAFMSVKELYDKRLKRENNSTNTQQSSMSRSWREQRSRMGLNRTNRQSRHVLSLRLRVRDGMSEHVPSQRKEPLTSRSVSRHGMSCKSVSRHTVASVSFIH